MFKIYMFGKDFIKKKITLIATYALPDKTTTGRTKNACTAAAAAPAVSRGGGGGGGCAFIVVGNIFTQ